jgi:hypothetical protein
MNATQETLALHHTPLSRMFHGDPLAYFLWKWGITPIRIGLLTFAYALIYTIIIPSALGRLAEVLQDWPTLVIVLVVSPVLLGYYAWEPFSVQALYDGIAHRVQEGRFEEEQIARMTRPFGNRVWFWLAVLVGLLESAYIAYQHTYAGLSWQNQPIVVATIIPLRFISFYAVTFVLVREAITMIGANRFMAIFPVEISPMHPDKAGGLRILGNYVLKRGIIVGLVGLLFGMNLLRIRLGLGTLSSEFYFEMVIYAVATPSFFLLPLWRAHILMSDARQKIMLEIAQKFEAQYYISLEQIRSGAVTDEHVSQIETLQKFYEIAEKAPTWPLNIEIVSQFSAAILLPVFLPMTIDFLGSLMQQILRVGP